MSTPAALGTGLATLIPLPPLKLTPHEWDKFVATLQNPPGPNQALVDAAARYTRAVDNRYFESVAQQNATMAILRSNEFRCIATVWKDDESWRYDVVHAPYDMFDGGRCKNMLTASIEREYKEMSTELLSSAIVFTGPCAEFHGYTDDTQNYRSLSERYLERKQLLTQVTYSQRH